MGLKDARFGNLVGMLTRVEGNLGAVSELAEMRSQYEVKRDSAALSALTSLTSESKPHTIGR